MYTPARGRKGTQILLDSAVQNGYQKTTNIVAQVVHEKMILHITDWLIVFGFFIIWLIVGLAVSKRAGSGFSEYFLSGRQMPWWLLGVSMVATTFSSDTPNLVTDMVRQNGVSGNWLWWAFLLTGMLTVFVYAQLWRRSGVLTDLEFYEIRYSGKAAAFLRGFRALYLGVFFNVIIMASVSLAAIMLGISPLQTILIATVITAIYSASGGLRGVLITDFLQFVVAMAGSIAAAIWVIGLPQVGGLTHLLSAPAVVDRVSLLPDFGNTEMVVSLLVIPLAVQWWGVWYPGSEPGGGGYITQRMLSARTEKDAIKATLFFNAAHYALRPWPWILVALASLIVFPDLPSLQAAFPHIDPSVIRHDLAYPAMLTFLPVGLLGLVVASLAAAYMSTISTHLNWGSSYVVNDFYKRFIHPHADDKRLVLVGRLSTVVLMVFAAALSLLLSNALQAFTIMLQVGAGTGLLFILRWFWWRINAWCEIAAMIISFLVAVYFQFIHTAIGLPALSSHIQLVLGVAITTAGWIVVSLVTAPTEMATLRKFHALVQPGGPGWKVVRDNSEREVSSGDEGGRGWNVPLGILCMLVGCVAIYGALFATGMWLYGRWVSAVILTAVFAGSAVILWRLWRRLVGTLR
jgi:SSS family solute:Na+ symporter